MGRHLRADAQLTPLRAVGLQNLVEARVAEGQAVGVELREDHLGDVAGHHRAPLLELEALVSVLEQVLDDLALERLDAAPHLDAPDELRVGPCGLRRRLGDLAGGLPAHEFVGFAVARRGEALACHLRDEDALVDVHDPAALLDVDRPLDRVGDLGDRLHHVADERRLAYGVALGVAEQQPRLEGQEVLLVGADVLLHLGGRVAAGERVGVLGLGQQHHAHVHPLPEDHVDAAQRGVDARRVAVVDDGDVLGEAPQQAYLVGRQRRARRRDDVLHAGLVHRDHVGVALDQDGVFVLLDRLLGEVEAVELALLAVDLALGRVLVLGYVLVGAQRAAAEGDHAARDVVHGEDHAVAEAVEERSVALAPERETRGHEKLLLVARCQGVVRHAVALGGAESQAELADRGVGHAARLAEVAHPDAHPLALAVEVVGEVGGGPAVEGEHRLAVVVAPLLLGRQLALLYLDAVALGHGLQRLGVGHALVLHEEGHGVAALAAAEALVDPLGRGDDERRGLLVVERAARGVVHALAPERDEVADNVHDVGGGVDAVYRFPVDHPCKGNS